MSADTLTPEQREVLRCCREDLWAVIATRELREAVAAEWYGPDFTRGQVEQTVRTLVQAAQMFPEIPQEVAA